MSRSPSSTGKSEALPRRGGKRWAVAGAGVLLLLLWLGGIAAFEAGSRTVTRYKEGFWAEAVTQRKDFIRLSAADRDRAHIEFSAPWGVRPGDAPFRRYGWRMGLAYRAQVAGYWLKAYWPIVYVILVFCAGAWGLIRSGISSEERTIKGRALGEVRVVLGVGLLAAAWFLIFRYLLPSAHTYHVRYLAGSYAYLWDGREVFFWDMSRRWTWIFLLYPFLAAGRVWGAVTRRAVR
ncbi:MAG: hypothetical protein GX606_04080 [Elusimicrobia bacterium]|nr:hypothetical protein [Elusimicrobiota bacterium]